MEIVTVEIGALREELKKAIAQALDSKLEKILEYIDSEEKHYTVNQVAEKIGIHSHTVYDLIHSGEIKYFKAGRSYRVSKKSLFDYLETSKHKLDKKTNG